MTEHVMPETVWEDPFILRLEEYERTVRANKPGLPKAPRGYQSLAHDSLWNYIHTPANYGKNPLVVMATGLGKSLNIAMALWHLTSKYTHVRSMCLAHVAGLVQGNYRELKQLWPGAPAGVYAAGLGERDTRSQITYAMINSVANRAATFGHIDFVFIDEAHRLSPEQATLYGRFLADLRKINPKLIVIGFTATDYRTKGGRLTDIGLFDEVVFDIGSGESFVWAVQQGYLILPVPTDPGFELDETGIGILGGDYKDGEAADAMDAQNIIERAVDYTVQLVRNEGRKRALIFNQSIEHADLTSEMFTYKGLPTYAYHSRSGSGKDELLEMHKRGEVWGLTNKDILTTGHNDPGIDLLVGLRLTRSPGLWVQMVGRTTRPIWLDGFDISTREGRWGSILASGKHNARVLDFTGNTNRLGPINYPHIPGPRKKGSGPAPVRTCKQCDPWTFHHTSVKQCPHCDYVWPVESNIHTEASTNPLVSATNPLGIELPKPKPKILEAWSVHEMNVSHNVGKHTKDSDGNTIEKKLDTLLVTYRCGTRSIKTWICFEHGPKSFPRRKAVEWWRDHGGQGEPPYSIAEVVEMCDELHMPVFLQVDVSGQYPQLEAYDFEGTRFEPVDLNNLMQPPRIYEPDPDPYANAPRGFGTGEDWMDDDIPF